MDSIPVSISTAVVLPEAGGKLEMSASANGYFERVSATYGVGGNICVSNRSDFSAINLQIKQQVEVMNSDQSDYEILAGVEYHFRPVDALTPGESRCFAYTTTFQPVEGAFYRAVVSVKFVMGSEIRAQQPNDAIELVQRVPFTLPTSEVQRQCHPPHKLPYSHPHPKRCILLFTPIYRNNTRFTSHFDANHDRTGICRPTPPPELSILRSHEHPRLPSYPLTKAAENPEPGLIY